MYINRIGVVIHERHIVSVMWKTGINYSSLELLRAACMTRSKFDSNSTASIDMNLF